MNVLRGPRQSLSLVFQLPAEVNGLLVVRFRGPISSQKNQVFKEA